MADICMKDVTEPPVHLCHFCQVCGAPGDKFAFCWAAHATCESCLTEEIIKVLTERKPRLACQVKGCKENINTGSKKDNSVPVETIRLDKGNISVKDGSDLPVHLFNICQVCGALGDKFAFCRAAHATCKSCLTEEITKVLTEHKPMLMCQAKGCKENINLNKLTVRDPSGPLAVILSTSASNPQDTTEPIRCPKCYGPAEFQEKSQLYRCPDVLCRMVSFKWWRISIPTGQTEDKIAELVKRYSRDKRASCPEERVPDPACLEDLHVFPKRWKKGHELNGKVELDVNMKAVASQGHKNNKGSTQRTIPTKICQVCQEPTRSQTCRCSKFHVICRPCLEVTIKRRIQADKNDGEERRISEICDVCCKVTSGLEFVVCRSSHVICDSCMMRHITEFLANSCSPPAWLLGCPVEGCLHALNDADLAHLSRGDVTQMLSTHWKLLPQLPFRPEMDDSESSDSDAFEEPQLPSLCNLVKRPSVHETRNTTYTNMFQSVLGTDNQKDITSRNQMALVQNQLPVKSRWTARSGGGRYFQVHPPGASNSNSSPSFPRHGRTPACEEQADVRMRYDHSTKRCHVCGDHHPVVCSCPSNHTLCLACVERAIEDIPSGSEVPLACLIETCQEHISWGELQTLRTSHIVMKYLSDQSGIRSTRGRHSYSRFLQPYGPTTSYSQSSGATEVSRRVILTRNPPPSYLPLKTHLYRQETREVLAVPAPTQNSLACPVIACDGTILLDGMRATHWIREFQQHIRRSQVSEDRQVNQQEQVTVRCALCGTTAVTDQDVITFQCPSPSCQSVTCQFCKSTCSTLNDPSHEGCCLLKFSGDVCLEDLSETPAHWYQYHDSVYQHARGCMLVQVALEGPEGSCVVKCYGLTSNSAVKAVWRVQNPFLWHKYNSRKVRMMRNLGRKFREKPLFYGASSSFQDRICQRGFDFPGGTKLRYFGRDTPFYTQARLAEHLSQDCNQVLIAFILCGKSGSGRVSYLCKWRDSVGNQLDTLVDDMDRPTMCVFYSCSQCYPAYVVTFE